MLVYALDIGGSSVKRGLVEVASDDAAVISVLPPLTLRSTQFSDLKELVFNAVASLQKEAPDVRTIGISTTGSVSPSGLVVSAGHFQGYKDVSWHELIRAEFHEIEHVTTVNDGRASAWAEYTASPRGVRSQIHVVVGTGVGGGIVHNGELLVGDSGQAGYIGHIKVTPDPTPVCSCGSQGCVEALASASAVVRYYEKTGAHIPEPPRAFDLVAFDAQQGHDAAIDAFQHAGTWLGVGLGNAMNVLNPSVVTIGGGVLLASQRIGPEPAGPFFGGVIQGINKAAHRRVSASADVRPGRWGNDGGIIGAARLAAMRH